MPEETFLEESVTVLDIPVRVLKTGAGDPVLFLHGWGCNAETMKSVVPAFENRRTSILIDFPGFGTTPPPPFDWRIDDYMQFTAELIRKLEISGCDVVAHSFGGRVMLKLMANPETSKLVNKVLITGGAGMKPRRKPAFYLKKYTAKLLKLPFSILPPKLKERGLNKLRNTSLWKKLGSAEYRELDGVMRGVFVNTVTEFLEKELPQIDHEILLLWGENDDVTPLYQAERMEKGLKNAALVKIPGAGHYAFLDQPSRFRAITKAFLG